MDDARKARNWQIAFDATLESIRRTRRTLVLLIGLSCVSVFHLYMWYASWDLARIAGRSVIIKRIERSDAVGVFVLGSRVSDQIMIKRLGDDIVELEKRRSDGAFDLALLGSKVNVNDFGIAAQMVGVAVLLWLIFNQKRLNYCLTRLETMGGWLVPTSLLELHFGLIGAHADSKFMRYLARLLTLALPIVSMLFLISDMYDLSQIRTSQWQRWAFESWDFRWRIFLRMSSDFLLGICVAILGLWSYREWRETEDKITRFSRQVMLPGGDGGEGILEGVD
jgi:TRAP-type C4-dicarboxylate transport system permease small subunit